MVLVGDGCAKKGHDAIAGKLIDGPLEAMHPVQENLKAAIHEGMDLLGIEALREGGESGHVSKQDSDLFALPFERTAGGQDLLG
jgi:hypothetical protein